MKVTALALVAALFHGSHWGGEAQQQAGTQLCELIVARGNCDVMGDQCPVDCGGGENSSSAAAAGGGVLAQDMVTLCSAVAMGSACTPGSTVSTLCSDACDAVRALSPAPPSRRPIATTCANLIELGGCSHDLSVHDSAVVPGTRVSDMCPEQCSGLGGCAPTVADVSFLEMVRDRSGHGAHVELGGDACVDGAGVALAGHGWVELNVGSKYTSGGSCTVSLWLLKGIVSVWNQNVDLAVRREVLFSHPAAEHGGDFLEISLARRAWHDHFTLEVMLANAASWTFFFIAHRDEVPMWAHLSVVVDGNSARLYQDGIELSGERVASVNGGGRASLSAAMLRNCRMLVLTTLRDVYAVAEHRNRVQSKRMDRISGNVWGLCCTRRSARQWRRLRGLL